jgi:hypothetical protein
MPRYLNEDPANVREQGAEGRLGWEIENIVAATKLNKSRV